MPLGKPTEISGGDANQNVALMRVPLAQYIDDCAAPFKADQLRLVDRCDAQSSCSARRNLTAFGRKKYREIISLKLRRAVKSSLDDWCLTPRGQSEMWSGARKVTKNTWGSGRGTTPFPVNVYRVQ